MNPISAFITDWPGEKQHAKATADIVRPYCPVYMLDDPDAYFNQQWDLARSIFLHRNRNEFLEYRGLLWVMGDVWPPKNFESFLNEALRVMFSHRDIGWLAPDVAWTGYIYDKSELIEVEPDICEVPNTDSLCFLIRGDVVAAMPRINPETSFMWGMDYIAIATARLMGLKAVRDYRFKAEHPNDTRYDIDKASQSMKPLFAGLDKPTRDMVESLMAETSRLRRKAPQEPNSINPPRPLSELEKNQIESARRHREGK